VRGAQVSSTGTIKDSSISVTGSGAIAVYLVGTGTVNGVQITGTDGLGYTLSLHKTGVSKQAIALTYASFGHWEKAQGTSTDRLDRWFVWGIRTTTPQIPTGTGHFDGIIRGTAARFKDGQLYSLSGTSSYDMNFGAGNFTGSLNPIGTSLADETRHDFGSFNIANGRIDSNAGLNGNIVNSSDAYLGAFEGALFGPQATDLGGSVGLQTTSGTPGTNTVMLNGVIVAKRAGN
jgi:hypothetical protein